MCDTPPEQDHGSTWETLLEKSCSEATASGSGDAHHSHTPQKRADAGRAMKLQYRRHSDDFMKITKFDGENFSPETWMKHYEKACEYNDWKTDSEKVSRLANHLTNGPLGWFNNNIIEHGNDDWLSWKENFLYEFEPYKLQAAQEALSLQFSGDVIVYVTRKEVLLDRAFGDLTDEQFQTLMMLGMTQHMITYIENHNPKDREHFMSIVRTYSRVKPPMHGQSFPYEVVTLPADEYSCQRTGNDEDEENNGRYTGNDDDDENTQSYYGADEEDENASYNYPEYDDEYPGYYESDDYYHSEATGYNADGASGESFSDDRW